MSLGVHHDGLATRKAKGRAILAEARPVDCSSVSRRPSDHNHNRASKPVYAFAWVSIHHRTARSRSVLRGGRSMTVSLNPMDRMPRSLSQAPRCLARTRRGSLCQCPASRGKNRCRIHGAAPGSGAPKGEANGSWKHGGWTHEAVDLRREVSRLLSEVR